MIEIPRAPLAGVFALLPIEDVHYGPGSVIGLAGALAAHGVERALLVTGTTLATTTDLVERVRSAAGGRIAGVFHETVQHVHRGSVLRAAEQARAIGADGVVSFGGGTANDTGKAVMVCLSEGITTHDGFDGSRVKYEYPSTFELPSLRGRPVPMVAVSTTLSGGEFTHFIGITDEVRRVKDLIIDRRIAAKAVFLDAELTLATPDWLWASTGMRSVDHCIEALQSSSAHPFTDALAIRSLAMLDRFLRECKADPADLVARTQAHIAAWMSVCSLANVNLGLSHGIGHQLGARCNVPHGITSCVMLPHVMEFNRDHVGDRQRWIAEAMSVDTQGMSRERASAAAVDAVRRLVADLGLASRLSEVGVGRDDFEGIARDALDDVIVAANPRPVTSTDEVIALLERAL
jgi:alcohol dehydrogenase class IV